MTIHRSALALVIALANAVGGGLSAREIPSGEYGPRAPTGYWSNKNTLVQWGIEVRFLVENAGRNA